MYQILTRRSLFTLNKYLRQDCSMIVHMILLLFIYVVSKQVLQWGKIRILCFQCSSKSRFPKTIHRPLSEYKFSVEFLIRNILRKVIWWDPNLTTNCLRSLYISPKACGGGVHWQIKIFLITFFLKKKKTIQKPLYRTV